MADEVKGIVRVWGPLVSTLTACVFATAAFASVRSLSLQNQKDIVSIQNSMQKDQDEMKTLLETMHRIDKRQAVMKHEVGMILRGLSLSPSSSLHYNEGD